MRSNASILGAFLLLTACGGGDYGRYQPEYGLSPAAQAMPAYEQPQQPRRGYEQPAPQQVTTVEPEYSGAGTSYARPGSGYDAPAPQPRRAYTPPPQQQAWQDAPIADPADGASGPRGSSQRGAGEDRYDEVGYAGVRGVSGGAESSGSVVAVHRSLPAGSFVEVTSLETGRTILVLITGPMGANDRPMDLSSAAAQLLGSNSSMIPVRIRKVNPSAMDQNALRAGHPASERFDTPPVLLNALRKQLPPGGYAAAPAPAPAGPSYGRPAPPRPAARGSLYVQVAALSNQARAQSVASSLGGFVRPGGGLFRIQMGPFASAAQAEQARRSAAAQGFADARVFTQN